MTPGDTGIPGDLILYPVSPRSAWSSKLVAIGELLLGLGRGMESYSHVAILASERGWQYEARWPKTGCYSIDRSRPYEVWRLHGITEAQRRRVIEWCRGHLGEWYDLLTLVTAGLIQSRHTAVCSQFAGRAYAHAGRPLREHARLVTPNDIADNRKAFKVWTYPGKGRR